MVASDAPGLRDSVRHGETGLLTPHGDVEALASAMARLLGDDALFERQSRAALTWSRRFDWDRTADEMAAVLESAA